MKGKSILRELGGLFLGIIVLMAILIIVGLVIYFIQNVFTTGLGGTLE